MKVKKVVLAKQAKWSYKETNGAISELTGVFPADAYYAAQGTQNFLIRRHIVGDDFTIESTKNSYVIRLNAHKGHNLEVFLNWAANHELLPDLATPTFTLSSEREKPLQPLFPPLDGKEAKELINNLTWQTIDSPSYSPARKHQVATEVTDPQIAFQLAYYLHKKAYISPTDYKHLHADIAHNGAHGNTGAAHRIVITTSQIDHFMAEFPDAGSLDKPKSNPFSESIKPRQGVRLS